MHSRHLIALFTMLSVTKAVASVKDNTEAEKAGYYAATLFYNSIGIPPQYRHYAEVARFFTGCIKSSRKQPGNDLIATQKYQDDRVFRSLLVVTMPVPLGVHRTQYQAMMITARFTRSAATICRQLETEGFPRP